MAWNPLKSFGIKRQCAKCKKYRSKTKFSKNKTAKGGLDYICKQCSRELTRNRRIYLKKHHPKKFRRMVNKSKDRADYRRTWAARTRGQHISRGFRIKFSIDELHFIALKTNNCYLCGRRLNWNKNKGRVSQLSPTLENYDLKKVLSLRDILISCFRCNTAKGKFKLKEFIYYCKLIVKNVRYPK